MEKLTSLSHLTSPMAKIVIKDKTDETTKSSEVVMHSNSVNASFFGCNPTMSSKYEFGDTKALADKQAKIAARI